MKKIFTLFACTLLLSACFGDLNQRPVTETDFSADEIYSTAGGYEGVLAKIYASFVIAGQEKGGGNADLSTANGYDLMRGWFNLQESGTEEVANTWISGDKTEALTFLTWDDTDAWVSDTYYRLYYTITLCNEFLSHTADASALPAEDQKKVEGWAAEARFLRALAYWMVLDLYGQGPFVDETMGIGTFTPECYTGKQLFDFVESELTAIDGLLPARAEVVYGHASRGAARTLLAKIYLNAEVYGAGAKYTECIAACKKVQEDGYSLEGDYFKLFNASNDLRTNEIVFALVVDAENTVSWGATTYLVCGQCGNSTTNTQDPAAYGITAGWGMFRVRGELPALFTAGDARGNFFTDGQTQYFTGALTDQSQGYFCQKWSNLLDDGTPASNTAASGASIDWPFFRLADVYLMEAEAVLRGGQGASRADALALVNNVRERAFGSTVGNIADASLTLDFLLDERARELYFESTRRTDLVRYDRFTSADYLWQWKGGVLDGKGVDARYNVYPVPSTELSANPNIHNEKY